MSDEAKVIDLIKMQEQWAQETVQLLIDLNQALMDMGETPSSKANNLLDRYFTIQDKKQQIDNQKAK
jgi:hypothetical protein